VYGSVWMRVLVDGETLHIDATQIRADVSWEGVTTAMWSGAGGERGGGEAEGGRDPAGAGE